MFKNFILALLVSFSFISQANAQKYSRDSYRPQIKKPANVISVSARTIGFVNEADLFVTITNDKDAEIKYVGGIYKGTYDSKSETVTAILPASEENRKDTYKIYLKNELNKYYIKSFENLSIGSNFKSIKVFNFNRNTFVESESYLSVMNAELSSSYNEQHWRYAYIYSNGRHLVDTYYHSGKFQETNNGYKQSTIDEDRIYYQYDSAGKEIANYRAAIAEINGQLSAYASYKKDDIKSLTSTSASIAKFGEKSRRYYFIALALAASRRADLMDQLMKIKTVEYYADKDFNTNPPVFSIEYFNDGLSRAAAFVPKLVRKGYSQSVFKVNGEPDVITQNLNDVPDLFINIPSSVYYRLKIGYIVSYGFNSADEDNQGNYGAYGLNFVRIDPNGELEKFTLDYPIENTVILYGIKYTITQNELGLLIFTKSES